MTTILVLASLFCLYRIFQGLKDRQDERERQAEMERQRQEAARMRAEWDRQQREYKAQQAQYKSNLLRQKAIVQEQERAMKERERLAREQERQKKEQERQAAILEKHEEMLRKHEFQLRQAKRDIDFLKERLGQQEAQRDYLLLQQEATVPGSKEHDAIQRKIVVLDNQIHSTVSRYNRAVFNAKEAEKKLA